MNKKQNVKTYIISLVIGLLIFGGACFQLEFFKQTTLLARVKILSDAFFLPAVIYCGISGLVYVSNNGFFRMLSFGTKRMLSHLSKTSTFREEYKDYFEYYQDKEGHKASFGFILFPGLAFLLLSIIFMLIHSYLY